MRNAEGELGFRVHRRRRHGPHADHGHVIREFLPWRHMLTYCESILRVYNRYGRRDNIWKARIKILVKSLGAAEFARQVEADWAEAKDSPSTITDAEFARVAAHFEPPAYEDLADDDAAYAQALADNRAFARWDERNVRAHRRPGYASVTLSLKKHRRAAGRHHRRADGRRRRPRRALQLRRAARLPRAEPDPRRRAASATSSRSGKRRKRGRPRHAQPRPAHQHRLLPGRRLLLARQRQVAADRARRSSERFDDLDYLHDIGELDLNISGCMNACGHHHFGHIGVLGVDKNGSEWYQVYIGGRQGNDAALGQVIGPSFAAADMPDVVVRADRHLHRAAP